MTIFSFDRVSRLFATLIEETQIYQEMPEFYGYFDASYPFPKLLKSNPSRFIKIKPTILEVTRSKPITQATIEAIAPNLKSLKFLEIEKSDIHEGMSTIIAKMTNLTELAVLDFANEPDYYITLPPLPNLKKLQLMIECSYSEPAEEGGYDWSILRGMPNLESLDARPHSGALDFSRLTFLTNLRTLYIEIDDLYVDANIETLKTFESLQDIFIFLPISNREVDVILKSVPKRLKLHYDIKHDEEDQ